MGDAPGLVAHAQLQNLISPVLLIVLTEANVPCEPCERSKPQLLVIGCIAQPALREEVESAELLRQPLWNDRRHEHGPFDIIGDVHGCIDELTSLLERLGYEVVVDPRL